MKFVITGLPRCRTAWWAAYLTQGDTFCYHEASFMDSDYNIPYTNKGNSEAGVPDEFLEAFEPDKIVVVHRPVEEVYRSLEIIGTPVRQGYIEQLEERNKALDGMHVDFYNMDLKAIHDYLGLRYEPRRAEFFETMNVQSKYWR